MKLHAKQLDRAVGVLLASAAGDALGVPYEYGSRALAGEPQQLGGGLGGIAPGQWSDDTEMACAIATVAATGADLRSPAALDEIAAEFLRWYDADPPDMGKQTRAVLSATTPGPDLGARMTAVAAELHARTGRTAGNGSLMRTGPVALAHLGDRDAIVDAARAVSALTHTDPMAGDACALWCLAIDSAIATGKLDIRAGLDRVDPQWVALIDAAEAGIPSDFARNNTWVVSALQAAWSALSRTNTLRDALIEAVRAGGDTDTVAAITGSLGGARYGGSAVPFEWRRRLHGWPGLRARGLVSLAVLTVNGGRPDSAGWPIGETVPSNAGASTVTYPHPDDDGVLLGAVGALRPGVADAVVSLCRLGANEVPLLDVPPEDHIEVWIVDKDDSNNDIPGAFRDAADAVRTLRAEGKTVLLHCVHAQSRTPLVAAVYGALLKGTPLPEALDRVVAALPSAMPRPSLLAELRSMELSGR